MICISRKDNFTDNFRGYKIMIDDTFYGTLNSGETKNIDIPVGKHTLYLKIDWCRSNKLDFSITNNENLKFECGNSMKGLKFIFSIFYITILKNRYLWLKEKNKYLLPNNNENL